MNKEFEKEYRNYIAEQAPDLWDRIEAGLKEKSTGKSVVKERGGTGEETFFAEGRTEKPGEKCPPVPTYERSAKKEKNGGQRTFAGRKRAAVLVSAAAVFLCLFVSKTLWDRGGKSDTMMADNGNDMFMEMEADGFADCDPVMGGADLSGSMEDRGEAAEDVMEDAAEDAAGNGFQDGGVDPADNLRFLKVRVRIGEEREPARQGYTAMYLAEIIEIVENPQDHAAGEGAKIAFYTGPDTDGPDGGGLEAGEEYEVVLEPVPGEENYFAKKINFFP